ncbi:MAG: histone deacetylase [Methanoregula sp.]|uniref:histone deacetylase family protein n=1 Tax=Methanoregula sp. TaxID=2052170 RepID=UPI003D0BA347
MKRSLITGPIFEYHNRPGHIECYDRLRAITEQLPEGIPVRPPLAATEVDLKRVHLPGYLSWLHRQCALHTAYDTVDEYGCIGGYFTGNTYVPGFLDANTYLNPRSYEVATFAAGSAIAATERVLDGESCFALVRPPGHHAASDWAMGFCIINNTAIAAAKALTSVDRVAIVDWDVHHGNGTQDIFYGSDRVLYCSVHAEDFFPGTGAATDTGTGAGAGCTVNAPLPQKSTIGDYVHVFSDLFLPLLKRAHPDLVIVSAGQDALADDPVGGMGLLPVDYGTLAGLLLDALDLPPAFVLEGGYGPSHPAAINAILGAVSGKRSSEPVPEPSAGARERVRILRKLHGLR